MKFAAEREPELLVSKAEKMLEASLELPPLALMKFDNSSSETLPSLLLSNRLTKSLPTLLVDDDEEDESPGGPP